MTDWQRNWRAGVHVGGFRALARPDRSSRFFAVGAAAVILTLLGGTTWAQDGFWSPDGGYSTIAQLVAYLWIAVISGVLYVRSPATARSPERAAVPVS